MSLAIALFAAGLSTATLGVSPEAGNNLLSSRAGSSCDPAALIEAGFAPAQRKRMDELPPAYHHLAVVRTVAGCAIATVRFRGDVYWVPLNPQPTRDIVPLAPVRPEDGRSRRP